MESKLGNVDFKSVDQFGCRDCIVGNVHWVEGPYTFMGRNFNKVDYDYIRRWLKNNRYNYLIGFNQHKAYLCDNAGSFLNDYGNNIDSYCYIHNPRHKLQYLDCEKCFITYYHIWDIINACGAMRFTKLCLHTEQMPEHICNKKDATIFLELCKFEVDGSYINLNNDIKIHIIETLFPNRTKSAANI